MWDRDEVAEAVVLDTAVSEEVCEAECVYESDLEPEVDTEPVAEALVTELVGVGSENEREVLNKTDLVKLEDDEPVNALVTVVLLLIVCVVAV